MTKGYEGELKKLRTALMQCLLRKEQCNASPGVYVALLAPPSLCPQFARLADGLVTMSRVCKNDGVDHRIRQAFLDTQPPRRDGATHLEKGGSESKTVVGGATSFRALQVRGFNPAVAGPLNVYTWRADNGNLLHESMRTVSGKKLRFRLASSVARAHGPGVCIGPSVWSTLRAAEPSMGDYPRMRRQRKMNR